MNEIIRLVESLLAAPPNGDGKAPVANLGFISSAAAVHIKHVPFYDPCLILVLSGKKVLFEHGRAIACDAGGMLAVPAPAGFDLRNEPDALTKRYKALVIPFEHELLERLRQLHEIAHDGAHKHAGVLKFERDERLLDSVRHYLGSVGDPKLAAHRLLEILLILVGKEPTLLSYIFAQTSWSQKVRAVFASDLARTWDIAEVCSRLATTESTLRRNLKKEGVGFREILGELRLSTALMRLLQTSLPVYRVAYDCGYQSVSRFSANFHKRFGLPPKALRASVTESEQKLSASEQSAVS